MNHNDHDCRPQWCIGGHYYCDQFDSGTCPANCGEDA